MEAGLLTKVINDFFTVVEGELSLSKGDYFLVHYVIDKYWCYGESRDKKGSFPSNHLHKVDIPNFNDFEKLFVASDAFRGEEEGDLSFGEGELIVGEQQVGSDWYSGRIGSKTGIFPLTHVWLVNPTILKKPTTKKSVRKKARVKTSLKAQLDEELDLSAGEIVTVIEILDDGWALGTTSDGRTGTFPEAFVTYIEDNTESNLDSTDHQSGAIGMDPFPQSVINGGKIYKDFDYAVPQVSSEYVDEEPAPSYYDLFPGIKPPAEPNLNSNLNVNLNLDRDTENPSSENGVDATNLLGVEPYAITLYPFNAQFPNELNFEAGEVVHLIKHIDSLWAEGSIDNSIGIFPRSYVNIIVDCPENNQSQDGKEEDDDQEEEEEKASKPQTKLFPGDLVKVLYTFNAQMNGDLSVTEGEIITIVEITNDDWLTVRNKLGNEGLCPRLYLSEDSQAATELEPELIEDFVVIRNPHRTSPQPPKEETAPKRLSEPHRPAPPAPVPGSIPLQKHSASEKNQLTNEEANVAAGEINETELAKQKRADQRQNVITELVLTEKDLVRDLKITYETFHLYDPSALECRGIDVTTLFGNILEVIHVAEELLDSLHKAMKGIDENKQMISPCFLKLSSKLQSVYGKYCGNQEAALALLKKYEENRDIMVVFEKGIETLRYQMACFDMSSILIKPVQRIVKYPLMLYELIKCTDDDHPDRPGIEEAWKRMTDVASYINEYKRRKDIVSKYLDTESSLMSRMSKLNMHSFAKKTSRLSAKLASTLGITNIPPDSKFEELEKQFKSLETCAYQLAEDVSQCIIFLNEDCVRGELLADYINHFHSGVNDQEVYQYYQMRVMISTKYMKIFKTKIEKSVIEPISMLINLLTGPATLITKRHDKLLDYDNAISKAEKNKESRVVQDELMQAKGNYEALNAQLLDELPVFIDAAIEIIVACIKGLTNARKLFNGRIMKQYLSLPKSTTQLASEDILQTFLVNHNLLWNQISRFSFAGVNPKVEEPKVDILRQSDKDRATLRRKYAVDKLYVIQDDLISTSELDLGAAKGTIVAVIKTQDPMGDATRWFVDNGTTQGFIPRSILQPLLQLYPPPIPSSSSSSSALSLIKVFSNNNGNDVDAVDSRTTSPPDLISLESPQKKKNVDVNLISLDSPEKKCNSGSGNSQYWYLNIDELCGESSDDLKYKNLGGEVGVRYDKVGGSLESLNSEPPRSRYQNLESKFYHATYEFDSDIDGTLAVKKGQALKLIRPHDEKGNSEWWLMEDRDGKTGYVPSNYLNLYQL